MNHWTIVINTNAGRNRILDGREELAALLARHGLEYKIEYADSDYRVRDIIAGCIEKGCRYFAIAGGDGTLNEAVNAYYRQNLIPPAEIVTALFATGTGNDWLKTQKSGGNPEDVVAMMAAGKTRLQDVGKVCYQKDGTTHVHWFVNIAGMAFDAYVLANTNRRKEKYARSRSAYLTGLLLSLIRFRTSNCRVYIDDKLYFEGHLFTFNVGICRYNGGGMMQVPHAVPDDGLFDVTIVRKVSRLKVLANVKRLYDGSIDKIQEVSLLRGKKVKVEADEPVYLETDGESLGHTPVHFDIVSGGFRFICP